MSARRLLIFHNLRAVLQARRKSGKPCAVALSRALRRLYHPDAAWRGPHPFNHQDIGEAAKAWWTPLMRAFPDLERRDFLFFGGVWQGQEWLTACGHFVGTFARPFLRLAPTGGAVFLRFGEFHRLRDGRIAETTTIVDLIDFARQAGARLLPESRGAEMMFLAPATHSGVILSPQDQSESRRSLGLIEEMLAGLMAYQGDAAGLQSMNQRRFWHPQMMWFGPAGIGATRGLRGFEDFHQRPFLEAFPDRKGGDHYARIGEGRYAATSGWPSLRATHAGGDWLGLAPTGKKITMRVMDWWRREGDLLRENWVLIDIPELFNQLGADLLARIR